MGGGTEKWPGGTHESVLSFTGQQGTVRQSEKNVFSENNILKTLPFQPMKI